MRWPSYMGLRREIQQRIVPIVLVLLSDIGYVLVNETIYSLRLSGVSMGQIVFLQSVSQDLMNRSDYSDQDIGYHIARLRYAHTSHTS
jgi:hypothetical protein